MPSTRRIGNDLEDEATKVRKIAYAVRNSDAKQHAGELERIAKELEDYARMVKRLVPADLQ
jgi:hypothetical protein